MVGSTQSNIKIGASELVGFDKGSGATVSDKLSDNQDAALERLKAKTEEAKVGLANAKSQPSFIIPISTK